MGGWGEGVVGGGARATGAGAEGKVTPLHPKRSCPNLTRSRGWTRLTAGPSTRTGSRRDEDST